MATTIKLKNGSGAPLAGDLVQGEPALDLTNKRLYTEDSGGTVIEVGTNPTSLTTGTFTSTGIDDNATSTAITIDASENVGIGTASPNSTASAGPTLEISGTAGGNLVLSDSNATSGQRAKYLLSQGGVLYVGHSADNGTSPVNDLVINASGNVGIGTTSPNYQLTIGDGTDALETINIISTDASQSRIFFSDASNNGQGRFTYDHSDDSLQVFTNDTERMRIDSSGRVGIGTSDPSSGTSTYYDDLVIKNATSGTGAGITIQSNTTNGFGAIEFRKADGTQVGKMYASNADGQLAFETGGTERMRIDSSGNVGIGTASPNKPLEISATDGGAVIRLNNPDSTVSSGESLGSIEWQSNDASTPGGTGTQAIINVIDTNAFGTAYAMTFTTSDSGTTAERMRIDSSGNLLVGRTSTPSGIQAGSLCINFDIHHQDAAGNDRLLYDRSANLLGNAGTNVTCATLSKSSGSFKIDHPLPEKTGTHHLVHSFVEAPQADNIYRGTVALVGGSATVNLDNAGRMSEGTFVLLNTNIQCFTTNESGWTAVKGSVSGNVLTITAKESCDDTVSWLVVGERCDQHMIDTDWTNEAGRIITEPLKGA
jgi:hypothetical protein